MARRAHGGAGPEWAAHDRPRPGAQAHHRRPAAGSWSSLRRTRDAVSSWCSGGSSACSRDRDHPLALFLDDLQWLDAATLDLLEDLLTPPGVPYLMLIGAYRDNEVTAAHPLTRTLDAIQNSGANVTGDRACAARERRRTAADCGRAPLRPGACRPARATGAREDGRQSVLSPCSSDSARRRRTAHLRT